MKKRSLIFNILIILSVITVTFAAESFTDIKLDIIPLFQRDYPKVLFTLKGKDRSVALSGCGAICVSMIIGYFKPEIQQSPETLLTKVYEDKLYRGYGLSQKALMHLLSIYDIEYKWCQMGKKGIRDTLKNGSPIIAYMGKGRFTNNGHYILITGINSSNMVTIIDPNNRQKSERTYPISLILRESVGSLPYIACYGPANKK